MLLIWAAPNLTLRETRLYYCFVATGKKDGRREAELEAAIERIRHETWKTGQTLPKLRRVIALILQESKHE